MCTRHQNRKTFRFTTTSFWRSSWNSKLTQFLCIDILDQYLMRMPIESRTNPSLRFVRREEAATTRTFFVGSWWKLFLATGHFWFLKTPPPRPKFWFFLKEYIKHCVQTFQSRLNYPSFKTMREQFHTPKSAQRWFEVCAKSKSAHGIWRRFDWLSLYIFSRLCFRSVPNWYQIGTGLL